MASSACSEEPLYLNSAPITRADAGVDAAMVSEALQADGDPCNGDAVCESGHCNNRVCCSAGECCRDASDCSAGETPGVCTDPTSCSGMKPVATCDANQCRMRAGENDTACDETVEADPCGLFKPVFCNGEAKQSRPECPAQCDSDDECDPGAHCQLGDCLPNAGSGTVCQTDSQCATGQCVNGSCCDSDNCCTMDSQCDAEKYGKQPTCDAPETCQGSFGVPACQSGRCGTKLMDDDSACNEMVVANECSGSGKVYCRGGRDQSSPPTCASGTCTRDLDCVRSNYCKAGSGLFASGMCTPDLPNSSSCDRGEVCQSGHCSDPPSIGSSGVCCSYDCNDATALCPGVDCSMMMDGSAP